MLRARILLAIVLLLSVLGRSSAIHTEGAIAEGRLCQPCVETLDKVQEALVSGKAHTAVVEILVGICDAVSLVVHPLNAEVCSGILRAFGSVIVDALSETYINGSEICSVLHLCESCPPQQRVQLPSFSFDLPDITEGPEQCSDVGTFVQVTDIHLDLHYVPGSSSVCKEPMCCRTGKGKGESTASYWGHYSCDVPESLVRNAFENAALQKPDFVLFTGDAPPHDDWQLGEGMTVEQAREDQLNHSIAVARMLREAFGVDTPIFPTIAEKVDQFPGPPTDWFMPSISNVWDQLLPQEALESVKYAGFYTTKVHARSARDLRVVTMMSMFCDVINFYLIKGIDDKAKELIWLNETLAEARATGEDVLLLTHIPPGDITCLSSYSRLLNQILTAYSDVIVGIFTGHTHNDQLELLWDRSRPVHEPRSLVFIAPSITTYQGLNPSYRTYTYCRHRLSSATSRMLDYTQFSTNMEVLMEAGKANTPKWDVAYSFREEYNVASLSPKSVAAIIASMAQDVDDSLLLSKYLDHFYTSRPPKCDASCRIDLLCNMNNTIYDETYSCNEALGGPRYSFSEILELVMSRVDPDYLRKLSL